MQLRTLTLALAAIALTACGGDSTGPGGLAPVATVSIANLPDTLLIRQRIQLTASAADDDGAVLPDRPVSWVSSDPDVLSITAGGVVTALAPGTATISVTTDEVSDSAIVVVRALELVHVYAGATVACGLEETGQAWCWGNVGTEGYGNGSLDSARTLVPSRAARGHAFSSLAIARSSACGVELTGSVVCWGANDHGQLGTGTTMASGTPLVVSGVSDMVQLVAGAAHYCARSDAGAVTCWGSNEWKQTGQEERADVTPPHTVALGGAASDLGAGDYHTCAVVAGIGSCWGSDQSGQLGNDTTYDRLVPVRAAISDSAGRTWSDVKAIDNHTCGQDAAGAVYCWGFFSGPALDDPDTLTWLPMRRFQGLSVASFDDGYSQQCAVTVAGEVWCGPWWSPASVKLGWARPATTVATADAGPCILDDSGAVACHTFRDAPGVLTSLPLPQPAIQLASYGTGACALDTEGAVYCSRTSGADPSLKQPFGSAVLAGIFGGESERICGVTATDSIRCWRGNPLFGATAEPASGYGLVSLAPGQDHTCGLTAAGTAWCWGSNQYGQLGDGTTSGHDTPVEVAGGHVFTQIAVGMRHTCGRTASGEIWCWGDGSLGQIADDHRDESATPVPVNGMRPATKVAGTCALDASGTVWCWPAPGIHAPEAYQIPGATGLVSLDRACGLRANGELLCWRDNVNGQFGNGTFDTSYDEAVPGGSGIHFKEVSLGDEGSACGVALDDAVYCWGGDYGAVPVVMVGS